MLEEISMTNAELEKYSLLRQVLSKQLKQVQAAKLLGLSDRQVRNLLKAIQLEGPKGIRSKKRGCPSNRSNPQLKRQIMALVSERYSDFGPTLATEKLFERHNIKISAETLRKWMIEQKLWISKKQRKVLHPLRPRRECFGELIQVDASIHPWFEDRADKCALIVFIDDSTSKITSAFFCESESLDGYFTALKSHIIKYGRPKGIYSDRHSIFGGSDYIKKAQFPRALKELRIDHVLARSPQAKGRVERANQTLQDRLIKEMRLRNINTLDDANVYLQNFIEEFNKKFSKEPRGQFDAHRPIDSDFDLEQTLARCEIRTLSKDLSFSFNNKNYQILEPKKINRLMNKRVEIRQTSDHIRVFYEGKELKYALMSEWFDKQLLNSKQIIVWKDHARRAPAKDHPWRKYPNKKQQMEIVV